MIKITENYKEYADIGVVKYVYNRNAGNYAIRISQRGEIRVTVPRFGSMRRAERFLRERQSWVKKKLSEIRRMNDGLPVLKEGGIIEIRGNRFVISGSMNGGDLETAFWKLLLREAKHILPEKVQEISRRHKLPFRELKIKKMRTRWGSCSSKNSINLNSWLVLLPDHLIDYVILHELVHTIHKNHSRAFWDELQRFSNGMALHHRKELREHKIMYKIEEATSQ